MRAPQQEVNKYLRWGLCWGLLRGEGIGSVKVVSDVSSAITAGSSSMTTTGTLALFAALSARVLKRNKVQREADQIQDKKQQESKKYKYNKKKVLLLLLFFLLVGAQRGEVEVWYPFCAVRRRSRLPWVLAGCCGRIRRGGSRRPSPSCRRSMRCSRGNGTCRGGACPAALRLLARLPPCCVSGPAKTPPCLNWGLH